MMGKPCTYTYILLSLAFIFVNLITLSNLTPWIDEVMMLDTSYNAAFHGVWETTAWYRVVGEHPFSTYPPLYQMLAAVWMRVFGGSLVAVRSMNLLITFVLGGVFLRFIKRYKPQLSPWSIALFTLLLWGSCDMSWMYRNGRPDMLCALMFVFTAQATDKYLLSNTPITRITVVITTAILLCSGIQAAIYLCALWLFLFFVMKQRRKKIVLLLALLLAGLMLGLLLVSLFMLANGRLIAFVCSIVQYSATLSKITLVLLPLIAMMFGFDVAPYTQKLHELTNDISLGQQLATIVEYHDFIILAFIALAAYTTCFRNNLHKLLNDKGFLLLLCALYVPISMTLAGRFTIYYRWMIFLPLAASIISVAARFRFWSAVFGVVAMVMSTFGIKSMLHDEHYCNSNLHSFVQRQHFKPSDAVVCPFSVFYEIKPVCDTCYFAGIYPIEFINHVDYIIEAPNGNEFDKPITNYVNNLKSDSSFILTAIDYCDCPSLTLYKVQKRHE